MKNFNWREKYEDFDELQDIETLALQKNFCIVRTWKLMPTLWFMQDAGWRIWSLEPDDEWEFEFNILTFYKPKSFLTPNQIQSWKRN